jgi:hypothetical protein
MLERKGYLNQHHEIVVRGFISEDNYKAYGWLLNFFLANVNSKTGRKDMLACHLKYCFSFYPNVFQSIFAELEHTCQLLHVT